MQVYLKRFFCVVLSLIIVLPLSRMETSVFAADETVTVQMTGTYGQTEARKLHSMVNQFRTSNDAWYLNSDNKTKTVCKDLKKLKYDYELEKAAMQRAMEIALSFSHTRPDGNSCFTAYDHSSAAENIAAGYSSAKAVFQAWQETNEDYAGQGHRRNMLNSNVTAMGVGHVKLNGYDYWVQEFRNPAGNLEATKANDSKTKVSVDVQKSQITSTTIKSSVKDCSIVVGESLKLPSIKILIKTADTWPDQKIPVKTKIKWKSADDFCLGIENNKLIGKEIGQTKITASALGKNVKITVKVKPEQAKLRSLKTLNGKKLKVTWAPDKKVSGYQIQYSTDKKFKSGAKSITIAKNSTTSKTITKLKKGKKYYVRIRAYKKVKINYESQKIYGSWSISKLSSKIK
ncbi:MAG: CAP domain-containing protein [Lachnospiraceae bacterium]|nr:CAP domain-containing protein [Lachnospiraceae bacterium]